jgi:hypothetical protein
VVPEEIPGQVPFELGRMNHRSPALAYDNRNSSYYSNQTGGIEAEELQQVILVGHSFAGAPISVRR